jgi:carbon-monoxide dehydrogenase medium subunit
VDGTCRDVSIVLGGVASEPLRVTDAEAVAEGAPATEATWREVAAVAAEGIDPPTDLNGDADYRRALVRTLTERAFAEALETGPSA